MLTYGQMEREQKTPTLEVSNYMLTVDSNLDPDWSLDDTNVSSLRRRKVLTDSNRCVTPHSSNSNISTYTIISSVSNPFRSTTSDEKSMKSRKMISYPKITTPYPRILLNNTIHQKDINKIKKLDGKHMKPPSSQPPIFLKCKIKKKIENNKDKNSDDIDENSLLTTTDLDIQFSRVNFESLTTFDSSSENSTTVASENRNQTLKQYCNFEDKKVMRIAPHIRRKDVICDTVDAWSYSNSSQNPSTELCQYKPLIFGGTYPIDLPIKSISDLCITKFEDVPIKKFIPKTYYIDVPTNCE